MKSIETVEYIKLRLFTTGINFTDEDIENIEKVIEENPLILHFADDFIAGLIKLKLDNILGVKK